MSAPRGQSTPLPSIPAIMAPPPAKDNRFTRSPAGLAGVAFLVLMLLATVGTLPLTFSGGSIPWYPFASPESRQEDAGEAPRIPRYSQGVTEGARLPPFWIQPDADAAARLNALVPAGDLERLAREHSTDTRSLLNASAPREALEDLRWHRPRFPLGTDALGRDLFVRCLGGGGVSLTIGLLAALISVTIGTLYGAIAGYVGGSVDAVMMRIVDILYGLPYILLVVLLAVASDGVIDRVLSARSERAYERREAWIERAAAQELSAAGGPADASGVEAALEADPAMRARLEEAASAAIAEPRLGELTRAVLDLGTLLVAIGGVSWLTMSRVIRGQVLSLKARPFMEAARAIGVPVRRQFFRHLLPNLLGPIIVYSTLTVPQAILQESFLSFLGIGVRPPIPSWGNLAAEGLSELNRHKSHWWTLVFPCALLGATLLALNFVGEGLREAFDPKRARR